MTLSSIDTENDVNQKCAVAEDLLSAMHSICPRFLTVISTPLVYQLGGIGHMLAGNAEGSLTEAAYQRVRTSLISLGDLLENLESGLQSTAGTSKCLRLQIAKIDNHMQAQRSSSSYASSAVNPSLMTASYPPGQRSVFAQHPTPLGHQYHGVPVQTAASPYQVPQEVITAWPWPFESQNDSQHPANNMTGFNG
jgi:hypothetical protein